MSFVYVCIVVGDQNYHRGRLEFYQAVTSPFSMHVISKDMDFQCNMLWLFFVHWFKMGCLCCYRWRCWSSLRRLSLNNINRNQTVAISAINSTCIDGLDQFTIRRVWRYQRGNQKPYIVEEQTTQWPKEKVLKDKQRSTKHTYKTKDQVTRTPLKTGGEHRCSGRQAGPSPLVAPVVSI